MSEEEDWSRLIEKTKNSSIRANKFCDDFFRIHKGDGCVSRTLAFDSDLKVITPPSEDK
jgi:hypothetical protein